MTNNKNTRRGNRGKANANTDINSKNNASNNNVSNNDANSNAQSKAPETKNAAVTEPASSSESEIIQPSSSTSDPKSSQTPPTNTSANEHSKNDSVESKSVDSKSADSKSVDAKPVDAKPADAKSEKTKSADSKPSEAKSSEGKSSVAESSVEKASSAAQATTSSDKKSKSDEKTVKNSQASTQSSTTKKSSATASSTTAASSTASNATPHSVKPKCGKGKRFIFAVILALLIAGLAFVGFQSHQLNQKLASLEQANAQSNAAIQAQIQAQLSTQTNALKNTQMQLNQLVEQQKQQAGELNIVNAALPGINKKNLNDWVLAEANYLLTIAERRIALESDVQTALRLLIEADKRLASLNDIDLITIRKAIAEDITKLQAVKPIDQEGLVLKLMALQKVIPELPLRTRLLSEEEKSPAASVSNDVKDWKQNLQISLDQFVSSFVTFRAHNGDVPHLLTGDQHFYLQENLKSKLDGAMQGIRYQNDQMYQESLQIAYDWSQVYFNREAHQVQQFNKELETLKGQTITAEKPKLLNSPKLLNALVAGYFGQELPVDEAASNEETKAVATDPTQALDDAKKPQADEPTEAGLSAESSSTESPSIESPEPNDQAVTEAMAPEAITPEAVTAEDMTAQAPSTETPAPNTGIEELNTETPAPNAETPPPSVEAQAPDVELQDPNVEAQEAQAPSVEAQASTESEEK